MSATITAYTSGPNSNNFNTYLNGFFTTPSVGIVVSNAIRFQRADEHVIFIGGEFLGTASNKVEDIAGGTVTTMSFSRLLKNSSILLL